MKYPEDWLMDESYHSRDDIHDAMRGYAAHVNKELVAALREIVELVESVGIGGEHCKRIAVTALAKDGGGQ